MDERTQAIIAELETQVRMLLTRCAQLAADFAEERARLNAEIHSVEVSDFHGSNGNVLDSRSTAS